jgi:hypothetical protein
VCVKRNIEALGATIMAVEKVTSITNSESMFVALGIQRAKRMRHTVCHLWSAPLYNIFQHFLTNSTIFRKKIIHPTKCVFWIPLQRLSETFPILRRTGRDVLNAYWSAKYPAFFSDFS